MPGTSPSPPSLPPPSPLPCRRQWMPWSVLLARVFYLDALLCPKCGGRRKVLAFLTDPEVVRKILSHLGLETAGSMLISKVGMWDPERDPGRSLGSWGVRGAEDARRSGRRGPKRAFPRGRGGGRRGRRSDILGRARAKAQFEVPRRSIGSSRSFASHHDRRRRPPVRPRVNTPRLIRRGETLQRNADYRAPVSSPRKSRRPWSMASSSSLARTPNTRRIRRLSMDRKWSISAYDGFASPLEPGARLG